MNIRAPLSCVILLAMGVAAHAAPEKGAAPETAYQRCVAAPIAPGFHWSPAIIQAFCADRHVLPIEYSEVKALLDKGQGQELDRRFARILADYYAGRIAEGSARQAFMAHFDWAGDETSGLVERWLQQSPRSPYALAARGIHRMRRAAEARGGEYIDRTPRENIERMEREIDLAKTDLTQAVLANDRLLPAYEALIDAARLNGEDALRDTALKGALAADPKNYYVRAACLLALQPRWGGSLEAMDRLAKDAGRHLAENPRLASLNTQALAERAWFTQGNDSREDLPIYENALLAAPYTPALSNAGFDAGKLGRHQRSVELFSEVLRFWPNSAYERTQRARAYVHLGKFDLARVDLDHVLARAPGNASALREYAQLHLKMKDHEAALTKLERARKADPADTWTLRRLAWIHIYKKRDAASAQPLVNELIKRDPKSGAAWLLRADVIQNLGQPGLRQAAENFVRYADTGDEEQRNALPKVKAWLEKHPAD